MSKNKDLLKEEMFKTWFVDYFKTEYEKLSEKLPGELSNIYYNFSPSVKETIINTPGLIESMLRLLTTVHSDLDTFLKEDYIESYVYLYEADMLSE